MRIDERLLWLAAGGIAVMVHSGAVVVGSEFFKSEQLHPQHELRLEPQEMLAGLAVSESESEVSVVSESTDAALARETSSEESSAVGEEPGGALVAESNYEADLRKEESQPDQSSGPEPSDTVLGESEAELPAYAVSPNLSPIVVPDQEKGTFAEEAPDRAAVTETVDSDPAVLDQLANRVSESGEPNSAEVVEDSSNNVSTTSDTSPTIADSDGAASAVEDVQTKRVADDAANDSAILGETGETSTSQQSVSSSAVPEARQSSSDVVQDASAESTAEVAETESAGRLDSEVTETQNKEVSPAEPRLALALPRPVPQVQPPKPKLDVAAVVREFNGGACFLAVPRAVGENRWQVKVFGAEMSKMDQFRSYMDGLGQIGFPFARRPIQDVQCEALEFANKFLSPSDTGLKLELDSDQLADGDNLTGRLSGIEREWIYATLVDDEGQVQDVSRYARVSGSGVEFSMPVHVRGAGRKKTQLLFFVSTDRPLSMLDIPTPQPLDSVLHLVRGQIAATGADVAVAVADFEIR